MSDGLGQARGFGQLRAPMKPPHGEDLQVLIEQHLRAIRAHAVPGVNWQRVDVTALASGTFQPKIFPQKQVFNCIVATVTAGVLYIWEGSQANASAIPDYVFSAADTRQIAIAQKEYDTFTFLAFGASTTASVRFGNVG